mmetsp:Transcript_17564/g.68125  ORF Transcript_17564/g.68125 Transcript_17564/m.68125 type:complete len:220 (+) Transcript_17564:490-1149(+)
METLAEHCLKPVQRKTVRNRTVGTGRQVGDGKESEVSLLASEQDMGIKFTSSLLWTVVSEANLDATINGSVVVNHMVVRQSRWGAIWAHHQKCGARSRSSSFRLVRWAGLQFAGSIVSQTLWYRHLRHRWPYTLHIVEYVVGQNSRQVIKGKEPWSVESITRLLARNILLQTLLLQQLPLQLLLLLVCSWGRVIGNRVQQILQFLRDAFVLILLIAVCK